MQKRHYSRRELTPGRSVRNNAPGSKKEKQLRFVGLLRSGLTPKECAGELSIALSTYYDWRKTAKFGDAARAFTIQCDRAIAQYQDSSKELRATVAHMGADLGSRVTRDQFGSFTEYLEAFRLRYFGFETYPHLKRVSKAMEEAGPGSITMILMPPEWMKTTFLEDRVCAKIAEDPNVRIAWVTEGQPLARKSLGRIQRRLSDDSIPNDLITHFGPFKGVEESVQKPWNADFFTVLPAHHDERDYTVATAGIKSIIRGARWDEVVIDDPQSIRSLSETSRLVEIFRTDIVARPSQLGRIFIIGSRVGPGDFYETLLAEDIVDELVQLPALDLEKPPGKQSNFPPIFRDGVPVVDRKGVPIGWSDEALAKRRKMVGEEGWARVYMQQPISRSGQMVTEKELLACCDRSRVIGTSATQQTIISLDPALKRHAAFTVCSYETAKLHVTDVIDLYQPIRNEVIFNEFERLFRKYHPTYVVIEDANLQSGYLVDDRFLALQEEFGFRAVGHTTGTNKRDPNLGIPALMNAIIRREVTFPGGGTSLAEPGMVGLFEQLMRWRPDIPTKMIVQDAVMSLWFNWSLWLKLRGQLQPRADEWKRSGLTNWSEYPYIERTVTMDGEPIPRPKNETFEEKWARLARL